MTLSEELKWRGFVYQTTLKDISHLDKASLSLYLGIDPSAPSMTIGNLATTMMVRHFINHGHRAVLLVGGATGMIGDPDGKSEERGLKPLSEIAANKKGIAAQYKRLFGGQAFKLVDNYDWFKGMGYLDFLRDVGKHVPMRQMLGRDFVQTRLSEDGGGISYAEFSYVLIQAYDFLHLNQHHSVSLQVCGSDQWGNSIAGVDLIRRVTGKEAHVWSAPLVINKTTGVKFGKSEDGAVWLDEKLTSVFTFYQFWLNVDDEGVEDYLKIYTLLPKEAIEKVMDDFRANRASRLAQKTLAHEVTTLVHGKERADSAKRVTDILFGGGNYASLTKQDMEVLAAEFKPVAARRDWPLVSTVVETGLASSLSEAKRFRESGAIYINGQPCVEDKTHLSKADLIHGYVILRRGKNSIALVRLN